MSVTAMEHVLVLSDDIEATRDFYCQVVGLRVGERPPLEFPGYWLYGGTTACVHVAERRAYRSHAAGLGLDVPEDAAGAGPVDHIAFNASDYEATAARLQRNGVAAISNAIPNGGPRQLFIEDPNGVRIEINVRHLLKPSEVDMAEAQTANEATTGGRRASPPFRADHVGSLLRPPELLRAREEFAGERITPDELRAVEDEAIRAVVKMQEDVGLQSATDGEFRRTSWHMDFIYQLGGISTVADGLTVQFRNTDGTIEFTPAGLHVGEKITLEHTIFGDAFEFLKSVTTKNTPKLTIPSPSMVHYRGGAAMIDPDVYPDPGQFWSDLTSAYAQQVKAVAELGCTYLQFDDTSLAYLNDPDQRRMMAERGEDAEHLHESYIRHINEALTDRPAGMTITTHMCRGNFRSSWVAEGGYDFVAEALFNELAVDAFFLEYDDARSGGFEPLRFVPKDKLVVLGLVTTKRGELEDKERLKARIDEAARYVPIEQLCLSPQCGFSSTVEGNALTYEQEVAKLELIVETAAEVWG